MYKLFLCLRYLRSRAIAWAAMVVVAMVVFLLTITVSVMSGFLTKIETAAKGLFGDVVIEAGSLSGLARYDEFADRVKSEVPEVEDATPFINTFGILRLTSQDYRQMVQIVGIRQPAIPDGAKPFTHNYSDVSDFATGLGFQPGQNPPTFSPPMNVLQKSLRQDTNRTQALLNAARKRLDELNASHAAPEKISEQEKLIGRLENAVGFHDDGKENLDRAAKYYDQINNLQVKIDALSSNTDTQSSEVTKLLEERDKLIRASGFYDPSRRVIIGLGLPSFSFRTENGDTVRLILPGHKIELMLLPLGKRFSETDISPNRSMFTVIDDSHTGVSTIDQELVYVPFETLQRLNNMTAEYSDGKMVNPARCSMIQIRVRPEFSSGAKLEEAASKIRFCWEKFRKDYPDTAAGEVAVQTWRERQAKLIEPIQKQRSLVAMLFGFTFIACVIIVFVIFYVIVVQKTRDIGILKSLGASGWGVGTIFLVHSAVVGMIGAALGVLAGFYTVHNINWVQDQFDKYFGFRVWSKEVFMFETIPNQVDWNAVLWAVVGAVLSCLVGALLPAITASRREPVGALRYE